MRARLSILGNDLVCTYGRADRSVDTRIPLTVSTLGQMRAWVEQYREAVEHNDLSLLLSVGRGMFDWLAGSGWVSDWLRGAGDRVLEAAVDSDEAEVARLLLDLPWEVLADEHDFLAADATQPYVVLRSLGRNSDDEPAQPQHRDLAIMFMAASPEGQGALDFDAEEAAVLAATDRLPVQVAVEESGCAVFLKDRLTQDGPFEVVHISCHGNIRNDGPVLMLETPEGEPAFTTPGDFAGALGERKAPLVFLSACRTAESSSGDFTEPFVRALVRSGVQNVLGWDGSVYDSDATSFAQAFYGELAQHASVPFAASAARRAVLRAHRDDPRIGHHWHLARVYVGPGGAGSCCARGAQKRRLRKDAGFKEFLDKARSRVPVATAREFVGRRRQAQAVLRAFRDADNAGVLLFGMGNLGKSSLAARIANRLPRLRTVVVYDRYDAQAIFGQLVDALPAGERAACELIWREQIAADPTALGRALEALLEGLFDAQPILLIVDDLEQILDAPRPGQTRTPVADGAGTVDAWRTALAGVLHAFTAASTESRLLITSRYDFTLDAGGRDLADELARVQLPPMDRGERSRQWRAAERAVGLTELDEEADARQLAYRAQTLAGGNPGLQEIICRPILSGELDAARKALDAVAHWKTSGDIPQDESAAQEFFQRVTFETYRAALTEAELQQLRAATLFSEGLPVPIDALRSLGSALGLDDPSASLQRLFALGLVDHWDGTVDGGPHGAVNALARPLHSRDLTDAEQARLASSAIGPIAQAWRDPDGDFPADERGVEAVRLALLGDAEVGLLDRAAAAAAAFLFHRNHNARAALAVLRPALARIEEHASAPSARLVLVAADCAERLGETELQIALLEKGLSLNSYDALARARFTVVHAGATIAREGPVKTLAALSEAAKLFAQAGEIREQAITMGKIADILEQQGDADEALRIRKEDELPVYERLGDVRERAITMGRIADILQRRGDTDEALRIRKEDELPVYERLGDIRSRAITMGQIADILQQRGDADEALRIRKEDELPVYERLGDVRSRAITMGQIADILQQRGDADEALRIREEEQLPVFERLGDVRSRAVTMGRIADVLQRRGDTDEALRIRKEDELPVYERLGDVRERAVTKGKIADILEQRGETDEALRIHLEERLPVAETTHDMDLIAHIRFSCATLRIDRGGLEQGEAPLILEELTESFKLSRTLQRVDAVAHVGAVLGQVLAAAGAVTEATAVLNESAEAFDRIGYEQQAAEVRELIDRLTKTG
jgi:tetratricopeptide (TPR) repeat protein